MLGSVYGKIREKAIRKRILGENDIQTKLDRLNLLILGAGSRSRNVKEVAKSLRVFSKISFLDNTVTGKGIIGTFKDALRFQNEYV